VTMEPTTPRTTDTRMNKPSLFPKTSEIFTRFPVTLIGHLRQAMRAPSAFEAFRCYCNLLEWQTTYLANLGNSVYKDRPGDQVDERLETHLRAASLPLSFGTVVGGLRALAQSSVDYSSKLPELAAVLSERLPIEPTRMVKVFQTIRKGRETYQIPPSHLSIYLKDNTPGDSSLGKCNLDAFLSEIVVYRNKGLAHQSEESWFPNDPQMYTLLVGYLGPALDELLNWAPMAALLSNYEVVEAGPELPSITGVHMCDVTRSSVTEGFAPLGSSCLILGTGQQPDRRYVARRMTSPTELQAVVCYVHFPQTLQTSDLLFFRYARHYLLAYLERGLITKTQRQSDLEPLLRKLAIPDAGRQKIESEIQQVIFKYKPDDLTNQDALQQQLAAILGNEWAQVQSQVLQFLEQLPRRRKDHIFDQIDNNAIMSFEQLRTESELSEPDLDSVLENLEQDGRVRRVGGSLDRAHAHFKAQDPQKPASFRAILEEFRSRAHRTRKYPGFIWKLVGLCESLLADDGIALSEGEVLGYLGLFEGFAPGGTSLATEDSEGAMLLRIGDEDIRASSVRDLFEVLADLLRRRGISATAAVPHLVGRTRYLVNFKPEHANGTPFTVPVHVDDLFFEASRKREQALTEVIEFLGRLGLTASSPDIEDRRETQEEDSVGSDEGETSSKLELEIRAEAGEEPKQIRGPTVPKFFTSLLEHLLKIGVPLDEKIPVRAGRIRYLLAEEPYHANNRRFDTYIERGGYFMNTNFSYEQAMLHARMLCEELGLQATPIGGVVDEPQDTSVALRLDLDGQVLTASEVPDFFSQALTALYEKGLLTDADIPYKSGRVRYLIAESPIHDHGRAFIRPVEVYLGGHRYFIEANISRQGALELVQRLVARENPMLGAVTGTPRSAGDVRA
jgi:DNA-binding HxlR family transcriptional regulator